MDTPITHKEPPMTSTNPLPHLLTIEELADHLGVTVRHIRRLIAENRVPYVKWRRFIRFDPDEIARWLDDARHPQRPEKGCAAHTPAGLRR
jgi:excisionase family DNA binding protein